MFGVFDFDFCSIGFHKVTPDYADIINHFTNTGEGNASRNRVVGFRDQCRKANVPLFFKQWGGFQKKKAGRMLDGRTYDEMPRDMSFAKA
ncbi:MAG: DUF5131 family protein [Anaerolineales bacterium]|nr:DUF5131 family protein [Anaerolineales bacterium]